MNGGAAAHGGKKNRPWASRHRNKRRKENGECEGNPNNPRINGTRAAKPRRNHRKNPTKNDTKGRQRISIEEPNSNCNNNEEDDPMVSIDEQLQRQREQRRKQEELDEKQKSNQPDEHKEKPKNRTPMVLGKYRYDPQRQSYFPMDGITSRRSRTSTTRKAGSESYRNQDSTKIRTEHRVTQYFAPSRNSREYRSLALPSLTYLAETCPSSYRRTLLRDAVGGRCLFNSATLPSVAQSCLIREQASTEEFQTDLVCKSLLHPSCRTLDVRENPTNSRPMVATIGHQDEIFCRSGLLGCRSSSRYGFIDDKVISLRHLTLPHKADTVYTGCLSYCSTFSSTPDKVSFHLLNFQQLQERCRFEIDVNQFFKLPNDFALCDDKIMFAPCRNTRNPSKASCLTLSLGQGSISAEPSLSCILLSGLPQSDVLCMEADSESFFSKKCLAMGHRNGQISLWDTASNRVSNRSLSYNLNLNSFGSTTSLSWLSNGYQILARGSLGDCHLHDVRRMGNLSGAASSSSSKRADPSLLWELSVPPSSEGVRSKIALYCNGIVMDPSQTVSISYLLSRSEEPIYGFWSLTTGQWIGEKQLTPNSSKGPTKVSEKPPPFLELCQTITPVFTTDERGGMFRDSADKNRFGIWFKCGRSVSPTDGTPTQSLRSGNIYHMSLSGGISQ